MKYVLPLLLLALTLSSCAKKKAEKQAATDDEIIQQYIFDNGLTAIPTGSGLYYVIETQGTGSPCSSASTVVVAYTGYYTDNVIFEQSPAEGVEFPLEGVIQGWTEGIPYFNEGGVGKLLIPSALAYGTSGSNAIPPNTVIIFDVELIDVL